MAPLSVLSLLVAVVTVQPMAATPLSSIRNTRAGQSLLALRRLDQRVATIGERLAVANTDLCRDKQWRPGFIVHDLSQYADAYRGEAIRQFRLDLGPGILAVAAGSPADKAGVRADDILISIGGLQMPRAEPKSGRSFDRVEAISTLIESGFAGGTTQVGLKRGDRTFVLEIAAQEGCASRFQVVPGGALNAWADGRYVQVTTAIAQYVKNDDQLAAVLAHEFAHNVLGHRERLSKKPGGNRDTRLVRETEIEADRLSIYLLDRAGYDVSAAPILWKRLGGRGLNFLGSASHSSWRQRAKRLEAEIGNLRQRKLINPYFVPPFALPAPR